jgi:hypothetical protein
MAKQRWIILPGGKIKRWKISESELKSKISISAVPPHWYRNHLNRKERRRSKIAIFRGETDVRWFVHPREASWYW